jgi:hypothetical protein
MRKGLADVIGVVEYWALHENLSEALGVGVIGKRDICASTISTVVEAPGSITF